MSQCAHLSGTSVTSSTSPSERGTENEIANLTWFLGQPVRLREQPITTVTGKAP
jgi:hypothetical protein